MVRMCDIDGTGEVHFEEFAKMATGQSLAPIGLAFPPSQDLLERKSLLLNLLQPQDKLPGPNLASPRFGS